MCTIHANSAREALSKLTVLPLLAGPNVTEGFVVPTVAKALDLVVHVAMDHKGVRRIDHIDAVTGRVEGGVVEANTLFALRGGRLSRANGTLDAHERFAAAGLDLSSLLAVA